MPLFHVHGLLAGLLAPLASGGSLILPPRFSASDFWRDVAAHGATWYTAVPTIHQILLNSPLPSPTPRLRFVRSCSSPLSPTVCAALEARLAAPVLEAYAMTEAAHQMTSNPPPPGRPPPGTRRHPPRGPRRGRAPPRPRRAAAPRAAAGARRASTCACSTPPARR